MPRADIVNTTQVKQTSRVLQTAGLFDIPFSGTSEVRLSVNMPIEEREWNIGLVVGPSGSGKSSIARECFADHLVPDFEWDGAVVDNFADEMSIKEITLLLSSVGFSSPPAWLRPYAVLSTGEQFRCTVARALAEQEDLVVLDEFTSVVDRDVAQIGSAAVAKSVRRRGQKFIAVTCHYDVEEWLQPDWVYDTRESAFRWRAVQSRPAIDLKIRHARQSEWAIFRRHHYLATTLAKASRGFIAEYRGQPVAFAAVISFPHPRRPGWRGHRTVTLPDFQGVGIGNAISELVAGMYKATGKPYFSTTSHPAMVAHRRRSPLWHESRRMTLQKPSPKATLIGIGKSVASRRRTSGFEFVGPALIKEAQRAGLI